MGGSGRRRRWGGGFRGFIFWSLAFEDCSLVTIMMGVSLVSRVFGVCRAYGIGIFGTGGHWGVLLFGLLASLLSWSSLLSCLFFLCFHFWYGGRRRGCVMISPGLFFMRAKGLWRGWMMTIMINELE